MILELYRLIFPNGKMYFGVSNNPARRWHEHRKSASHGSHLPVACAIRKFGADAVILERLAVGDGAYILDLERAAIARFNSLKPAGYNLLPGGQMSPLSDPAIAAAVGAKIRGRQVSAETRKAMSDGQKGAVRTPEMRQKLSILLRGKPKSAQTRQRMSEAKQRFLASQIVQKENHHERPSR